MSVKATFGLPEDAMEYMKKEARRRNVSMADVLRDAIATDKFIRDKNNSGADIVIEETGKRPSKLVFAR